MKLVLLIICVVSATIALVAAANFPNEDDNVQKNLKTDWEFESDIIDEEFSAKNKPIWKKENKSNILKSSIQGRSPVLSANGKRMVETFINHLPCGWPEAGIPPLAPYARKEMDIKFNNSLVDLSQRFEYFRIDGLDIMLIERLKVTYAIKKKVLYNLTFPRITISGKYFTDILVDALKEYGISVRFDGKGDFELMLENLNFRGSFKYNMPLVTGHTTIYQFDISMWITNIVSNIGGIAGNGKLNRLLNDKIEKSVVRYIQRNQYSIGEKLKEVLEPFINKKLEGRNMWTFFKALFGQQGKICYPPPFPW